MTRFWNNIRSDFPITRQCIYLGHASCGPIPQPVQREIDRYYKEVSREGDFAWAKWIKRREEVRKSVARFMNADPSEITFTQNTSHGMNLIAELLAPEGAVLTNPCEFPASTLPWIWRKAKMIYQKPENNRLPVKKLKGLLKPGIKTILNSFVQYATGFRQDLASVGKIKGDRYFVVNATQGLGVFPVDVQKCNIDFLCTNSHKWLMAGYGGGILYIRKKWLAKFKPSSVGWRSMRSPDRMDNRTLDLKPDASRYELGCPGFPVIFAIGAAVDYFTKIGLERIQNRVLELTDFAIRGLEKMGLEVLSPKQAEHRSGIVVCKIKNAERVWRLLLRDKIYVSLRGGGIRLSPHFYNSFSEIDIFLKRLRQYQEAAHG